MVSLNALCSCQCPEQLSVTMRAEVSPLHGFAIDKRCEQPCKRGTSARRVTISSLRFFFSQHIKVQF